MRIVHAADVHLDSPLKGLRELPDVAKEEVRLATRRAFIRLIDLCLEEQAALLLIAGDLFDQEQKDFHAGLFAVKQFARLQETGTAVVMVRGNHDAASAITKTLRDARNLDITILNHTKPEVKELEQIGVTVYGQSFPDTHVHQNLAKSLPARREGTLNIGLLHADVGGSADEKYAYSPCTLSDLLNKGYDYWALGHNHVRAVLHCDPYIVYPGNLQGRHIQETGPKGCSILHVEDGRIEQVVHRNCDTLQWVHVCIDASSCRTQDDVFDVAHRVLGELRNSCDPSDHPLVARISIQGSTRAHVDLFDNAAAVRAQIEALAAEWFVWHERIEIATIPLSDVPSPLPPGFLAALGEEFERLRREPELLQNYLSGLAMLDQIAITHHLSSRPTDLEQAKNLLNESAGFVLSQLLRKEAADISVLERFQA